MNQKINSIIQKLNKNSQRPIENENLLKEYMKQSLRGRLITFYNWECPPRILDRDKDGRVFINYSVDIKKVFRGEKIDSYTEIPRVVEQSKRENRILNSLKSLGLNFRFVKLIADTNAYYITPNSVKILSKETIIKKFLEFKRGIESISQKKYKIKPKVYLFSELIDEYRSEYENYFNDLLRMPESSIANLVSEKIWKEQLRYIKNHIGFKNNQNKEITDFSRRTIATYGVEGMVLDLLSKTSKFSNCVWLNVEEANRRVVRITNCLRIRNNLGKLPMIFPK